MKKVLIGLGGVIVLGVAWWLISPIWRTVTLDESLPQSPAVAAESNRSSPQEQLKAVEQTTGGGVLEKPTAPSSGQTVVLAEAPFVASAHEVQGKALLVQSGDQKTIRFENLKTIDGPDLRIYLSSDLGAKDYIDLGVSRATEGNVNYPIPAGIDTAKYHNVLIWCRAFSVLFSYATL